MQEPQKIIASDESEKLQSQSGVQINSPWPGDEQGQHAQHANNLSMAWRWTRAACTEGNGRELPVLRGNGAWQRTQSTGKRALTRGEKNRPRRRRLRWFRCQERAEPTTHSLTNKNKGPIAIRLSENHSPTIGSPSDGQSTPSQPLRQAILTATITPPHMTHAHIKSLLHQQPCHCCQSLRGLSDMQMLP